MGRLRQGLFKPTNPEKYVGDITKIRYLSGWEYNIMTYFDKMPSIISWGSEEKIIFYFDPVTNKKRRYFPDFIAKIKNKENAIVTYIIEVKPLKEVVKPMLVEGKTKRKYNKEVRTYITNISKWKAAINYCKDFGYKFIILSSSDGKKFKTITENEILASIDGR